MASSGHGAHHRGTKMSEQPGIQAEHLYDLIKSEFAHVFVTFPLVAEPVKIAALNTSCDVERELIR